MGDVSGDFEIHLTGYDHQRDQLAAFAGDHGLKYVYIELDRGNSVLQPMLTLTEAAPWNTGVPQADAEADEAATATAVEAVRGTPARTLAPAPGEAAAELAWAQWWAELSGEIWRDGRHAALAAVAP